mgnify:CR=1 FL=1
MPSHAQQQATSHCSIPYLHAQELDSRKGGGGDLLQQPVHPHAALSDRYTARTAQQDPYRDTEGQWQVSGDSALVCANK